MAKFPRFRPGKAAVKEKPQVSRQVAARGLLKAQK
jgi:hypothetical protein